MKSAAWGKFNSKQVKDRDNRLDWETRKLKSSQTQKNKKNGRGGREKEGGRDSAASKRLTCKLPDK